MPLELPVLFLVVPFVVISCAPTSIRSVSQDRQSLYAAKVRLVPREEGGLVA